MDSKTITETVTDMQAYLKTADKYLESLKSGCRTKMKFNTLLDAAMSEVENCCITLRRLAENLRPQIEFDFKETKSYFHKEIYGNVEVTENGWLDIRLNALLPHCKTAGSTQYITDTITRLLNNFESEGGKIPQFEKAFLAIIEHANEDVSEVFDHDNKGFKSVINAVKGRAFSDDNQYEMSLGMFTVLDADVCCHIYILPYEDASEFLYLMQEEML